jgi:hypothetical protein
MPVAVNINVWGWVWAFTTIRRLSAEMGKERAGEHDCCCSDFEYSCHSPSPEERQFTGGERMSAIHP